MKTRKRLVFALAAVVFAAIPAVLIARPELFTINSIPDANREPGQTFSYQAGYTVEDPVCFAEGVFFSLVSGPSGMTVSSDGQITWQVPSSPNNYTVDVTIKGVGYKWGGSPCYGGTHTDYETFTITIC